MNILDDPETPLEKRCYDEKGNNIFKAPPPINQKGNYANKV